MIRKKQFCLEAVTLLALATIVALTVNALRREGVALGHNYFAVDAIPEHGFQTVTLEEAYDYYDSADPSVVFIDARDDEHYQECRILGAIQFDYYHPDKYLNDVLDDASKAEVVIIYCNGGDCEDGLLAAQYLTFEIDTPLDYGSVYLFEGGLDAWEKAEYPTEGNHRKK